MHRPCEQLQHGIVAPIVDKMNIMQEPEIKRWTAKHKAELIEQIYRGQTTIPEATREYDLTHGFTPTRRRISEK